MYIIYFSIDFFRASGVSGNFLINGKERNLVEFRKMSSYIAQDFAMLDLLTVQETLKVSTDLKLTTQTKQGEKDKIASISQCNDLY